MPSLFALFLISNIKKPVINNKKTKDINENFHDIILCILARCIRKKPLGT
jgi:hypothetical protein